MIFRVARRIALLVLLSAGAFISLSPAEQAPVSTEAVQVIGMASFKNNTKGDLKVDGAVLSFASSNGTASVSVASIEDVVTGRDSERVLGGTVGTLSRLAPYGGGTALSLLRKKLDTITIQYRDLSGGLHGAIFTMPIGEADTIKQALLAGGAHTSVPTTAGLSPSSPAESDGKEQVR